MYFRHLRDPFVVKSSDHSRVFFLFAGVDVNWMIAWRAGSFGSVFFSFGKSFLSFAVWGFDEKCNGRR